ncbi:hypothetical protein MKJ04_01285 [Pontibacter sp. E15-1]|uniref:hypothetical protein n=1 Tax=Pontibacter sp. E15-1 TaxID=2919918 RepID=UPI001F4FBF72|nr:hypothetical protein [Pontibacter sp. E15-1]MCJ8163454.1 hypothetical protein [Pontibacter sp. E15-1]
MKNELLYTGANKVGHSPVVATLSFRTFWDDVRAQRHASGSAQAYLQQHLLQELDQHPDWLGDIPLADSSAYKPLFRLVQAYLLPPSIPPDALLWGLGLPMSPAVFFGTDALYRLLHHSHTSKIFSAVPVQGMENADQLNLFYLYSFLLERFYNYASNLSEKIVFTLNEEHTGLVKYYSLALNLQFVEVEVIGELPELDLKDVYMVGASSFAYLQEVLPLGMFHFRGFTTLTATDETAHYVVEDIKTSIIGQDTASFIETSQHVLKLLQAVVGTDKVTFGLLPFVELNHKLIGFHDGHPLSLLMQWGSPDAGSRSELMAFLEDFRKKPAWMFFQAGNENAHAYPFIATMLQERQGAGLVLLPVFRNTRLVGILEVTSAVQGMLSDKTLSRLGQVIPLLAELLHRSLHEFNVQLDRVIKQEFTPLQPSIQWKVNEVAWEYLKALLREEEHPEIGPVSFSEVYPLYGAIDMRDSTVERNRALRADLETEFEMLIHTLTDLNGHFKLSILDEKIATCRKWLDSLSEFLKMGSDIGINAFLEQEIRPLLRHYRLHYPETQQLMEAYFQHIDPEQGAAHQHRSSLEESMQRINKAVNREVKAFQEELQQSFPCYIESFRTDGVEYDVYIGQSITPARPFALLYLHNFRLMQMGFMARVTRLTHSLLPQMQVPIRTTQLIFAHGSTIDISFRKDEKRFDVEGAYNIRYQMVKKRIDKVHIKGTAERLTQPGKIAIVYFSNEVAEEYKRYIGYLQERQQLTGEVEHLELEELQGVSGLKAIRVSVATDEAEAV